MSNKIRILDNQTLSEIATIENIINPIVYEEINGSYTFSFDMLHNDARFLEYPNIVDVEGKFFRIARIQKERNSSVSVKVECEHISYELIREEDPEIEYEDTAAGIITNMLTGTGFNPGNIMFTNVEYYKPSNESVRQRLFDIANLFGGELIFDNFTIHLVERRGSNKGLSFELGENLIGVTEEIDNSQGYSVRSCEVDVVDLSQIPGYENFKSVEIGDLVNVIDPLIDVNVSYRVLSYECDPFKKIDPKIHVGNLRRDFTDYIREKEDEEKEDDTFKLLWLDTFTIDDNDILKIDGIDSESAVNVDVGTIPKTIIITAKEEYKDYYKAVNVIENGKSISFILNDEFIEGSLTINNIFTKDFLNGSINVTLSDKPYGDPEAITQSYFVDLKLTDPVENYLLEYFEIDNDDVLSLDGIDTEYGAIHTIYDQVQKISIKLKYGEIFDGVKVEFFNGEESSSVYDQTHFKNGILIVNTRFHSYSKGMRIKVTLKQGDKTYVYAVRCEKEGSTGVSYYIESETVTANSGGAQFDFTVPYDAVISVTLGIGKVEQTEPIQAYWSLIQDESEMYTGVSVDVVGLKSGIADISIQAVVQEGVEEVVTDE